MKLKGMPGDHALTKRTLGKKHVGKDGAEVIAHQVDKQTEVVMGRGVQVAEPGDYIAEHPDGTLTMVKQDFFEEHFGEAES